MLSDSPLIQTGSKAQFPSFLYTLLPVLFPTAISRSPSLSKSPQVMERVFSAAGLFQMESNVQSLYLVHSDSERRSKPMRSLGHAMKVWTVPAVAFATASATWT